MSAEILLTGANGQLGWEISRRAGASTLQAYDRKALDLTNADTLRKTIRELRPKVVINAAAYTAVDKAETEAAAAFAVNRDGPANLAVACAEAGAALIHISTDYVFDGSKRGPYSEDDPVAPLGVYGASKLAGEEAVRSALPRHVILRTAWVYSTHGHNFVKTMLRVGAERGVLRVVNDQHGCPTYAGDLAAAVLTIAQHVIDTPASGFGTFHCVGGGETTWYDFARTIFERASFERAGARLTRVPQVEPIPTSAYPTPAKRPANSVLNCARLAHVHGITLRPWREALDDMLSAALSANPTSV